MIDPLLRALFDKLPPPNSIWPVAQRRRWIEAMRLSFDFVYSARVMTAADLGLTDEQAAVDEVEEQGSASRPSEIKS